MHFNTYNTIATLRERIIRDPGHTPGTYTPTLNQHDTTSTENSVGELETKVERTKKKGAYGEHLRKENVLEEPGLVTGR